MKRTELACYCMLATAFILGALVFVQLSRHLESTAFAEMVVNKGNFTMVTTRASTDSELICVLDTKREMLMAYVADPTGQQLRRAIERPINVPRLFRSAVRQSQ